MNSPLESSIVRIYKQQQEDNIVGAGFLVSSEYIVTCAHVVNESLGFDIMRQEQPDKDKIIKLDFPVIPCIIPLNATVEIWKPVNLKTNDPQDIAILKIQDKLPEGARPIELITIEHQDLSDHTFKVLGFSEKDGAYTKGEIMGKVAYNKFQLEVTSLTGYGLEGGFSGTGIWDNTLKAVVGMAVSAEPSKTGKVAFFIPTDMLIKAFPDLLKVAIINQPIPKIIRLLSQVYSPLKDKLEQVYENIYSLARLNNIVLPSQISLDNLIEIVYQLDESICPLTSRLNIKYLEILIGYLILEMDRKNPFKTHLEAWLKEAQTENYTTLIDILEVKLNQLKESQNNLEITKRVINPCLLVKITQVDNGLTLQLNGWVIPNVDQYNPQKIEDCIPIKLNQDQQFFIIGEKDKIDELLFLETLKKLYQTGTKLCQSKINKIQVCIPHQLIETVIPPLDLLSIERKISDKILPAPMGVCYEVVYRFSERIDSDYHNFYDWKNRCNNLRDKKHNIVNQILEICDFADGDPYQLYQEIMINDQIIGTKIKPLKAEYRQDIMAVLYETGIPFTLWIREHPEMTCEQTLDTLCQDCSLNDLLLKIKEQRGKAWKSKQENHLGNHVSLLWDDADLIPPKTLLNYDSL